jgi:hypothetical protein
MSMEADLKIDRMLRLLGERFKQEAVDVERGHAIRGKNRDVHTAVAVLVANTEVDTPTPCRFSNRRCTRRAQERKLDRE